MRSAFESAPVGSFADSETSLSPAGSDEKVSKRIIGFPEVSSSSATASVSPQLSCDLSQRVTRQSSLGKALFLHNFEQEMRPKLSLKLGAKPQPKLRQPASTKPNSSHEIVAPFLPGTLPSSGSGPSLVRQSPSGSNNSSAVPIPALSKAYTAPEPLPELSASAVQRLLNDQAVPSASPTPSQASSVSRSTTPGLTPPKSRFGRASGGISPRPPALNRRPSPPSALATSVVTKNDASANTAATNAALAQVAALKEALRREQDEVSRLRKEVARLAVGADSNHPPLTNRSSEPLSVSLSSGTNEASVGPVTPDAAEQSPNSWH